MSASAGRVLIIPKGIYNAGTTYQMLDLVRFGKGTFICKKTSLGNEPSFEGDTEFWQLIASSGDVSGVKGDAETEYRDGNVNITYDNLGGVDANLSSLSSLPIQNKAVKAALDEKMDDMDFDNAPTLNSGNLLTSGTIKNALDTKLNTSGNGQNVTVAFTTNDLAANTTAKTSNTTNQPSTVSKLSSGETLASMFNKISSMFASIRKLWNTVGFETSGVSKVVGDTSVKFTNSAIKTTSELELLCENSTNTPIFYTGVTVTNGSATYTFNALTVATTFYLKVR